ncbi:ATPase, T2SS/T4P/T4SS family [Pseudomonas fluorescens]|uniref:Pilus assembly protein PilU n=1 Tax=Pseudomonas fluorescens TaxID=294 RepID=A0A2T0HMZ2_PSEFL|nr:ATPase, T2SS/T4P/T4SS family [Pseudomonas fluorescens]PRW84478.1 pilus assembly protein PilU [Pseudomonas fluorescens]
MEDLQSDISACDFIDLFVSNSFADVKGLAGADDTRVPIPDGWKEDVTAILELCRVEQSQIGGPEFSIEYRNVIYRVTHLDSVEPGGAYVLRQTKAHIRDFYSIGIPTHFVNALLDKKAVGLALICGGFGVGKTTTALSWLDARLKLHGGVALAIEDPNETIIDGLHGKGRCIAINASRQTGGYQEHLIRALRSGVDFIFLGEIRDAATAYEALNAGSNGKLILATYHALGIAEGLEKLIAQAETYTKSAAKLLANGLLGVMWQDLTDERNGSGKPYKRFAVETLLVSGEGAATAREKIRTGHISSLQQDIDQQATRGTWRPTTKGE